MTIFNPLIEIHEYIMATLEFMNHINVIVNIKCMSCCSEISFSGLNTLMEIPVRPKTYGLRHLIFTLKKIKYIVHLYNYAYYRQEGEVKHI